MSNIEPTEEQKQAAKSFFFNRGAMNVGLLPQAHDVRALAALLAEREAKLREGVRMYAHGEILITELVDLVGLPPLSPDRTRISDRAKKAESENATLRARVAELEASDALLARHTDLVEQIGPHVHRHTDGRTRHRQRSHSMGSALQDVRRACASRVDVSAGSNQIPLAGSDIR